MKLYVLGFLFNDQNQVCLIEKDKPEWQKGKLNGVGGKVEDNEDPFKAMVREFNEETGLLVTTWTKFCTVTDGETYEVICYLSFSNNLPRTTTTEVVGLYSVDNLPDNVVFNSFWLIPMALKARGYEYVVKECFKIENHDERDKEVKEEAKAGLEDLSWLDNCELCGEQAWDGRICHACGLKNI